MGQKLSSSNYKPPSGEEGRGGFGKVWYVNDKKTRREYAMKEMKKAKVIDRKSEISVRYERELLSKLSHSFIVNMHYSFQDFYNLYLVMDLLKGGDLRYHLTKNNTFNEEQTKFFLSCIIIALEYIHSKKVMHRDIKPENLVLDDKGYVRVTDFGIAKVIEEDNSSETSGTPGYISPEVMEGQNHSHVVDYYALGVIGYEFMTGRRPFQGKTRKEMRDHMLSNQIQVRSPDIPRGWTSNAIDFINKLLIKKPEFRLGYNSINELKLHPWYIRYPWNDITLKRFQAPFIPNHRENFDKRYCQEIDRIGITTRQRHENYLKNPKYKDIFENFTYYNIVPPPPNQQTIKKVSSTRTVTTSNNTNSNSQYNTIQVKSIYPRSMSIRNNSQTSFVSSLHQSDNTSLSHQKNKRSCRYQNAFNYSMKLIEQQRNKQKGYPRMRNNSTHSLSNSLSNLSLYKTKLMNSSKRSLSSFPKQYPNECFNHNKSTGHIKFNKRNNQQLNDSNSGITINLKIKKPAPIQLPSQSRTIVEKIHTIQRSRSNFGALSVETPSKKSEVEYVNQLKTSTPTYKKKIIQYNCNYHSNKEYYEDKDESQIDLNKVDPPMMMREKVKMDDNNKTSFEQLNSLKNILSNSPKKKIIINKRNNLSSSNSTLPSNSRGNKENNNT